MLVTIKNLQLLIPEHNFRAEELADRLAQIGHEAEIVDSGTLDVSLTANRGDAASVWGLARDLAGVMNLELSLPDDKLDKTEDFLKLTIDSSAESDVLADALMKIDGYQPTTSPDWLVGELRVVGIQAKDLVIDLTNYLAYLTGLPLHAFDFDTISDGLTIRRAKKGERIVLLDNKNVELSADALIQSSLDNIVDLVGVMGAKNSSVTAKTRSVVVQGGVFNPSTIRASSKAAGATSPASWRYQRGVDPALPPQVMAQFWQTLKKYAPGAKLAGLQLYQPKLPKQRVETSVARLTKLLGISVTAENLSSLEQLGFKLEGTSVAVPSWRYDVKNEADIAEEVLRLVGYDKLKPQPLEKTSTQPGDFQKIAALKEKLCEIGYTETIGYSFEKNGVVRLENGPSLTPFLRNSLEPSLLRAVAKNPFINKLKFFELGSVFRPTETETLAFMLVGLRANAIEAEEAMLTELVGLDVSFEPVEKSQLKDFDVKQTRVFYAELPLNKVRLPEAKLLHEQTWPLPKFKPISKFPPIVRDLTLLVDEAIEEKTIADILTADPAVLIVEPTDTYRSEELGANAVALTFRVIMQSMDRSLRDEEADKIISERLAALEKTVPFQVR